MKKYDSHLDRLFSFFVLIVICLLAIYMAVRIGLGAYIFLQDIMGGAIYDRLVEGENEASRLALQAIAETIILVKAYRILMSYVRTHHVSVEYIVEISIIASAIELLFANHMFDTSTKVILGVFGLANLYLYLKFFGPDHDEDLHRSVRKK